MGADSVLNRCCPLDRDPLLVKRLYSCYGNCPLALPALHSDFLPHVLLFMIVVKACTFFPHHFPDSGLQLAVCGKWHLTIWCPENTAFLSLLQKRFSWHVQSIYSRDWLVRYSMFHDRARISVRYLTIRTWLTGSLVVLAIITFLSL